MVKDIRPSALDEIDVSGFATSRDKVVIPAGRCGDKADRKNANGASSGDVEGCICLVSRHWSSGESPGGCGQNKGCVWMLDT